MHQPSTSTLTKKAVIAALGSFLLTLTTIGCGLGGVPAIGSSASSSGASATIQSQGSVHGGQQPITGATIKLYGAGTTGYGLGSASIMNTSVTTDTTGFFNVTGTYTCTPGDPVYIVASGGSELPATQGLTVSGYSIASNVATFTASNTLTAGQVVILTGFSTSTFLNGAKVTVLSTGLSSSQFEVNLTHADVSATAEAGDFSIYNSSIALMAALGTCPTSGNFSTVGNGAIPFIAINEVSTVSAVWALQQFMAAPGAGNVGAPAIGAPSNTYCNTGSSTANPSATASCNTVTGVTAKILQPGITGQKNAFTMANILSDIGAGTSPNTNYLYATPETSKINTVADVLATCVNSAGGVAGDGSLCGSLFSSVTPSGSTAAADTIQAALYMAQNPTNVGSGTLPPYSLVTSSGAPFTPNLSTAPKDWTIAVNFAPTYSSGTFAVDESYGVAIDAYGNAWISNTGGIAGSALAGVAELGADGSAAVTPSSSFTASTTGGSYSQFTVVPASNTITYSAPKAIAIDLNNNAWSPSSGTSTGTPTAGAVGVFTGSTGTVTGGTGASATTNTGYFVGATPWGIAVDANNNVYVTNTATPSASVVDGRSMAKLAGSTGTYTYSTSSVATAPAAMPGGQALIAIDTNPNVAGGIVWGMIFNTCKVIGQFNGSTPFGLISQYDTSLNTLSGSEVATALSNATVGAGSTGNCGSTSVSIGQVLTAGMANPFGIAVDKNNGLWISDVFTSSLGFDGLTYVTAPTASTGIVPTSYYLVNGVQPTSTIAGTPGTTMTKAAMDAVDGNGNVWVVSQTAKSFAEATLCTSTSPSVCSSYSGTPFIAFLTPSATQAGNTYGLGFAHSQLTAIGIGIDLSGNVWATNNASGAGSYTNQSGVSSNVGNTVTVLIGAAAPVLTPLSVAIANNHLGQKP